MRAYSKGLMLVAAIAAGAAFGGGDGGSGPSPSAITGTWQATSMLFVSQADPKVSVDVIAAGGSATLTLDANKSYLMVLTLPATAPETTTGTWSLSGDVLTMVPDGMKGNIQFNVTLSGQTLKLAGGHLDFDLNDDGIDDPAILTIEATR
jgi:hypothetical protein